MPKKKPTKAKVRVLGGPGGNGRPIIPPTGDKGAGKKRPKSKKHK